MHDERPHIAHQPCVRNMRQDRRLLAHQARRDAIALDDQRASAIYDEVMRDDHAERRSYRRCDADESCDEIIFRLAPHVWRCEEVVQRGLLPWRRNLLQRQAHVVYQQE
jgi:hypothetical protein